MNSEPTSSSCCLAGHLPSCKMLGIRLMARKFQSTVWDTVTSLSMFCFVFLVCPFSHPSLVRNKGLDYFFFISFSSCSSRGWVLWSSWEELPRPWSRHWTRWLLGPSWIRTRVWLLQIWILRAAALIVILLERSKEYFKGLWNDAASLSPCTIKKEIAAWGLFSELGTLNVECYAIIRV